MPYSTVLNEVLHEVDPVAAVRRDSDIPELRVPQLAMEETVPEEDVMMDDEDDLEQSHNEMHAVMCMERFVQGVVTAASCYVAYRTRRSQDQVISYPFVFRAASFAFSCRALAGLVLDYDWVFRSHAYPMTVIQIGATAAFPGLGHVVSGVMTGWFLGGSLLPRLLVPSVHGVHHPIRVPGVPAESDSSDAPPTLNRTTRSFNCSNRSVADSRQPKKARQEALNVNGGHSQLSRDKERQIKRWKNSMEPLMVDTNGDGVRDSVVVDTTGDGILDAVIPVRRILTDVLGDGKSGTQNTKSTPTASTGNGSGSELLAQSARRQSTSFLELPPSSAAAQPSNEKAKTRTTPAGGTPAAQRQNGAVLVPTLQLDGISGSEDSARQASPRSSPKHKEKGGMPLFAEQQRRSSGTSPRPSEKPVSPSVASPSKRAPFSPAQKEASLTDVGRVIDFKDVNIVKKIGEGHTSTVYLADWRGVEVAVKDMPICDAVLREVETQQMMNHPHIVQCFGYSLSKNRLLAVMEHCDEGSLESFLIQRTAQRDPITVRDVIDIARSISLAMASVHADGCIHRDLAARNVFKKGGVFKLGDFGLVREVDSRGGVYKAVGKSAEVPVNWTSPEALSSHEFSKAGDVWSFGVLLWEVMMYCSKRPYDRSPDVCERRVLEGDILERPSGCPEMLWDSLIARCFFPAQERPTFRKICQDIIPSLLASATTKPSSFYDGSEYGTGSFQPPVGLSDCYKSLGNHEDPTFYGPLSPLCLADLIELELGSTPPLVAEKGSPHLTVHDHLGVRNGGTPSHSAATSVKTVPATHTHGGTEHGEHGAESPVGHHPFGSLSSCDDSIVQCTSLSRGSSLGDVSEEKPTNGGSQPVFIASPAVAPKKVKKGNVKEPEGLPPASAPSVKGKTGNGPPKQQQPIKVPANGSFGHFSKAGSVVNNGSFPLRAYSQASGKGTPRQNAGSSIAPSPMAPGRKNGVRLAVSFYATYVEWTKSVAQVFSGKTQALLPQARRENSLPVSAMRSPSVASTPQPFQSHGGNRRARVTETDTNSSLSNTLVRLMQLTPFLAFCALAVAV